MVGADADVREPVVGVNRQKHFGIITPEQTAETERE
jgi:hypothetical protein